MRLFKHIKLKPKLRIIAVIAAMICSVMLLRSVSEGYNDKNCHEIIMIAYQGIGTGERQFSAEQIEDDIRTLTNKGYSPIFASQIKDILDGEADLPDKAVVMSFDGGCSGYYSKVYPILKKYRFKAVFTVNGKKAEYASNSADDNISFLRWDEIKEMDGSGLAEFSNGAYSFDNEESFEQKQNESYEEYRSRIVSDIGQTQYLFQLNCCFEPCVFTYPGGKGSDIAASLVKNMGFKAAMKLGNESVIISENKKADPYRLKRYERADYDNITDITG